MTQYLMITPQKSSFFGAKVRIFKDTTDKKMAVFIDCHFLGPNTLKLSDDDDLRLLLLDNLDRHHLQNDLQCDRGG
jgi:hypothetical protein